MTTPPDVAPSVDARPPARLVLADGRSFEGVGIGVDAHATGEVVFNTSMTGYQEALTDPSYGGQILMMTYPIQGNYGRTRRLTRAARPRCGGSWCAS